MNRPEPSPTSATDLARLFRLDGDTTNSWRADELESILKHQLAASIAEDLENPSDEVVSALESLTNELGRPPTFDDVIQRHVASPSLRQEVKRFAKRAGSQAEELLPREVSAVLYLASICAALIHDNSRISDSEDAEVMRKVRWAAGKQWLDPKTRRLFLDSLEKLS